MPLPRHATSSTASQPFLQVSVLHVHPQHKQLPISGWVAMSTRSQSYPRRSSSRPFHPWRPPNLRLARLDRGGRETGGCAQISARTWAGARIKVPVAVGARIVNLGVAPSRGTLARALFLELGRLPKVEDSRLKRVASTALELLRMVQLDIWKAIASVTGIPRRTRRRGPELTIIWLYVNALLPQVSVLRWRSNSS